MLKYLNIRSLTIQAETGSIISPSETVFSGFFWGGGHGNPISKDTSLQAPGRSIYPPKGLKVV